MFMVLPMPPVSRMTTIIAENMGMPVVRMRCVSMACVRRAAVKVCRIVAELV